MRGAGRSPVLEASQTGPEGLVYRLFQRVSLLTPEPVQPSGHIGIECQSGSHTSKHHDSDVVMSSGDLLTLRFRDHGDRRQVAEYVHAGPEHVQEAVQTRDQRDSRGRLGTHPNGTKDDQRGD